jgi:ribosome-binding factor A
MNESVRQKKVASLIKEALSRHLFKVTQDSTAGLVSITRVDMTKDLKKAHVYLSIYGSSEEESILTNINKNAGYLRKSIASRTKLKYNPQLIFSIDPVAHFDRTINELLEDIKQNEK